MADMAVWMGTIFTPLIPVITDQIVYDVVNIDNITQDVKVGDTTLVSPISGALTDHLLPTGVALVVRGLTKTLRTQGRKFFGGFTEINASGSAFNAAVLTAGASSGLAWITPFTSGTSSNQYTPGLWSYSKVRFTTFTEAVVNSIPGYQRRRKQGVGS